MRRARSALAATFVILLTSSTAVSARGPLTLPIPATAHLCPASGEPCHDESLAAGADLRAWVESNTRTRAAYRLSLKLPAGEFDLERSWLIGDLPPQISQLTISGSRPYTRVSGARGLNALGASTRAGNDGVAIIELPGALAARLLPKDRYTVEDPAWPVLLDAHGPLRLARWPRDGWAPFSHDPGDSPGTQDFLLDGAPPGVRRDAEGTWAWGFFKFGWHADYLPMQSHPGSAARYGIGDSGRYRLLNLRSEVRAAGDYYIDVKPARLLARLRGDSAVDSLRLTVLDVPLLRLRNTHAVHISAIEFTDTRGHALLVENSHDVGLEALSFTGIGRAGVVVDGGKNVHIRNSRFENLGDQAVVLRGGDRATLTPSGHRVEDCHIRAASQRLNTPATAIRLEGVGHRVRGNTIVELPHSAVYFDGNDHLIEANWIERSCLEVNDAGAIYAGRDWTARGTAIRRNVFTNIHAAVPKGTAVAVYLDDMLSGIRVEDNAFVDVDHGVLVGGGRDNLIERNIFVRTGTTLHIDERARTWARRAVAPGEVMDQRLRAVPVGSARWRTAYPRLAAMARDRAPMPEGNEVRHNVAAGSGPPSWASVALATGTIESPRSMRLPPGVTSAAALLEYCGRNAACQPFELPPGDARMPGAR